MNYENFFIYTNLDFEDFPRNFSLKGVSFEDRQNILPNLQIGKNILLIRDPYNKYDKYAIKVLTEYNEEYVQIGWIPKLIAKILSPEIDSSMQWSGKILKITGGNEKNYGIVVELFYKEQKES